MLSKHYTSPLCLAHFRTVLSDFSINPVAVTPDVDDHAVVQRSVQEGCHDDRILKQLGSKGKINENLYGIIKLRIHKAR